MRSHREFKFVVLDHTARVAKLGYDAADLGLKLTLLLIRLSHVSFCN